jgi:hypothetical protein
MKTFIFHSSLNKEVMVVIAKTSQEAATIVVNRVKNQIIKDDYILKGSIDHEHENSTRVSVSEN